MGILLHTCIFLRNWYPWVPFSNNNLNIPRFWNILEQLFRHYKQNKLAKPYLIFVISFTQTFCAVKIFYTQNTLFVTKLNLCQNSVNRSNGLCKMIHCGKIPIYFYRTWVNLGSELWVRMSVTNYIQDVL